MENTGRVAYIGCGFWVCLDPLEFLPLFLQPAQLLTIPAEPQPIVELAVEQAEPHIQGGIQSATPWQILKRQQPSLLLGPRGTKQCFWRSEVLRTRQQPFTCQRLTPPHPVTTDADRDTPRPRVLRTHGPLRCSTASQSRQALSLEWALTQCLRKVSTSCLPGSTRVYGSFHPSSLRCKRPQERQRWTEVISFVFIIRKPLFVLAF